MPDPLADLFPHVHVCHEGCKTLPPHVPCYFCKVQFVTGDRVCFLFTYDRPKEVEHELGFSGKEVELGLHFAHEACVKKDDRFWLKPGMKVFSQRSVLPTNA